MEGARPREHTADGRDHRGDHFDTRDESSLGYNGRSYKDATPPGDHAGRRYEDDRRHISSVNRAYETERGRSDSRGHIEEHGRSERRGYGDDHMGRENQGDERGFKRGEDSRRNARPDRLSLPLSSAATKLESTYSRPPQVGGRLGLTREIWDNAACRAAIHELVLGSAARGVLPASAEVKFREFVELFLSRRESGLGANEAQRKLPPQAASPFPIELPATFDRRYTVNFSVRLGRNAETVDTAGRRVQSARNDAEAAYEAREEVKAAFRAGIRASSCDSDRDLLRRLLDPPTPAATTEKTALAEVKELAKMFLDFRMKRSFKQLSALMETKAALPITAWEERIIDAVSKNPVILVAGDTVGLSSGCGKSTQVPQFLLRAGYGKMACTQPRRVASVALSRRVAYETLDEFGDGVGYQIRFETSASRRTRIVFLTEGLLLRQIRNDATLLRYDVIVVDEVHERHLPCDVLLAVLRVILRARNSTEKPLRLVLMSATLNAKLFSDYFGGAPVIEVPGRMYPVRVEYLPTAADKEQARLAALAMQADREAEAKGGLSTGPVADAAALAAVRSRRRVRLAFDPSPYLKLMQRIDETVPQEERGDLLVFLSGMSDLNAVAGAVREYADSAKRWIILLLHSALDAKEQDRVFDQPPKGVRKCVLSTNIAESSVTLDGVRFVADSGRGKELLWDPLSNTQALQEMWVSRASAEQRKGRAGRTGPGICFRMYSPDTFDHTMPRFSDPEALRSPMAGVVLDLKALGCVDPRTFAFITPPPIAHTEAALLSLALLGATRPSLAAQLHHSTPDELAEAIRSLELPTPIADASEPPAMTPGDSSHAEEMPIDVLKALRLDLGAAPLSHLGVLMSELPVDPPISRMLSIAAALSVRKDVVVGALTLAATLTTQSMFDFRALRDGTEASRRGRALFSSMSGDPFTSKNAFDAWLLVKAGKSDKTNASVSGRGEGSSSDVGGNDGSRDRRDIVGRSRNWCKRHGLQEQRLYEVAKLRSQLESALRQTLRSVCGCETGTHEQLEIGATENGTASSSSSSAAAAATSAANIQRLRREVATERGSAINRRVLTLGDSETQRFAGEEVGDDGAQGPDAMEPPDAASILDDLDFGARVDLSSLASDLGSQPGFENLTKLVLTLGLYPNVALRDPHNATRPLAEHQFLTRQRGGLFMQATCALNNAAADGTYGGPRADSGEVLVFSHLMETHKPFLSSVISVSAAPFLFLSARTIDCDADAQRFLIDHWILLEIPHRGTECIARACVLRAALDELCESAIAPLSQLDIQEWDGDADFQASFPELLVPLRTAWQRCARTKGRYMAAAWKRPPAAVASDLAAFLADEWRCTARRVAGAELDRLLFDPLGQSHDSAIRDLTASLSEPLGLLDGLWRHKQGTQLSPYFRFGSLLDAVSAAPTTVSEHMFSKWTCPRCAHELFTNLYGVRAHTDVCGAAATDEAGRVAAAASVNTALDAAFDSDKQQQTEDARAPKKSRRLGTSVKGKF